jgi:hypothetical protein
MLYFLYLSVGSIIVATSAENEVLETISIDTKVLSGSGGQCPTTEGKEKVLNEIHQVTYQVIASATDSYRYTCNGTPGWRRIAFIDMTNTSYNCPTGLRLIQSPKRTCASSHHSGGCSSTTFSIGELRIPYSRVCGRIRGYQFGVTDAFYSSNEGIDSYYVDGVSLTHGGAGRRQHIWTFASGLREIPGDMYNCPCDTGNNDLIPEFVGNDFFCESAVTSSSPVPWQLFPDDVLWDGQNCTSTSTCCQLNDPPWFTKNLPTATTDDIELRICTSAITSAEDIPIELVELYIQ